MSSHFGIIQAQIEDLTLQMRSHAQKGNGCRAEEIAAEIDDLQEEHWLAIVTKEWASTHTFYDCPKGRDLWLLSPERWAEHLIHAHLVSRRFSVSAGSSHEQALGHARYVYRAGNHCRSNHILPGDISPVQSNYRTFAALECVQ